MGSRSHDLGTELRMHSFPVDHDIFSNKEEVEAVDPVMKNNNNNNNGYF